MIAGFTRSTDRAVREGICGCSSGPVYYGTKGHAYNAVDNVLRAFSLELGTADFPGDEGNTLIDVYPLRADNSADFGEPVGYVNFSWYRMESGRYELTVYMA
jgi:hypothetical protein